MGERVGVEVGEGVEVEVEVGKGVKVGGRTGGGVAPLQPGKKNMKRNFDMNKDMITAEPIYILLASLNHPDAHEAVRELTLESQKTGKPITKLVKENKELKPYLAKFNQRQLEILDNPEKYIGIAVEKTEAACKFWMKELKI